MVPGTRNDGLRLLASGNEVTGLRAACLALPGIALVAAGGRNGPGDGTLALTPEESSLSWTAPGASVPGPAQAVGSDGTYMLEDGTDPSCWARVEVSNAYLPSAGAALGYLADVNASEDVVGIGLGDVSAADASAGQVTNMTLSLSNVTSNVLSSARLWIDPGTSGAAALTVSSDGVHFYAPTSAGDAHVLSWSTIAPSASVAVYLRRTIAAGAVPADEILNALQWTWQGQP